MINNRTCAPTCRIVPPHIGAGIIEHGTKKHQKAASQILQPEGTLHLLRAGPSALARHSAKHVDDFAAREMRSASLGQQLTQSIFHIPKALVDG